MVYQKVYPAELDSLYEMLEFIKNYGQKRRIPSGILDHIILATEEALINIISYGYPGKKKGTIEISCIPSAPKSGIRIVIKDRGVPFNPVDNTSKEIPSSSNLLEKSEGFPGGYGIHILIGLMDRVDYRRLDGGNRLTLIKYFA